MEKIWRNRLEAGTQIWGDCPDRYRDVVLKLLQADVAGGKITAEQFENITGEAYAG